MSATYRHAMRHGFIAHNPITLVRQGSRRKCDPEILTVDEMPDCWTACICVSGQWFCFCRIGLATW